MATLTLTMSLGTDDAVINDAGYLDSAADTCSATDHVVGTPGAAATAANSGQGWRFQNVTLTSADTATSAVLKLMKCTTEWQTANYRFVAIAEDNTATFSSGSAPGSRAIDTNIAAESVNANRIDGTVYDFPGTGALQTTLGTSVQAILNRAGWASGNALAIVNQSKQDASQESGFSRTAQHTYEDTAASSEPQLVITYTAGGGLPPALGPQRQMTQPMMSRW